MKSKTRLSIYSSLITILIIGLLAILTALSYEDSRIFWIGLAILLVMLMFGFFYAPMSVEADNDYVTVRSPLKRHRIRVSQIKSVELFKPTMGSIRVCGSGGFMGYWGIFNEGDIGRYAAFYGKSSDCFLLRLDNGDKYVLGCENPEAMVEFISGLIRCKG